MDLSFACDTSPSLKNHMYQVIWKPIYKRLGYNFNVIVTLTFELQTRALRASHHLLEEEHLCKFILKFIHERPSYSPDTAKCPTFLPLTYNCDLHLWGTDLGLSCDKCSSLEEHLNQILYSYLEYVGDMLRTRVGRTANEQINEQTDGEISEKIQGSKGLLFL